MAITEPLPAVAEPKPPRTYETICISTYQADLALLDGKVAELKRRGYTRANRSQLIRWAIRQLDLDRLPPHDSGHEP